MDGRMSRFGVLLIGMTALWGGPVMADILVQGSVLINNSSVNPGPGDIDAGQNGTIFVDEASALIIDTGSTVTAGTFTSLSNFPSGALQLTGSGATLLLQGSSTRLDAGFDSTLRVLNGALLDASDLSNCLSFCGVSLGELAGSTTSLEVSGAGSQLLSVSDFVIGRAFTEVANSILGTSTSSVIISAGGRIDSGRVLLAAGVVNDPGLLSSSVGVALVDGVGSQWNTQQLVIGAGDTSDGSLVVSAGGVVTVNGALEMSVSGSATSQLDITGAGSRLSALNAAIAAGGGADVSVQAGGELTIAQVLSLGMTGSEVTGFIGVDGTGSILKVGDDMILGGGPLTTGQIDLSAGARLEVGGASDLNTNGTFVVLGGPAGNGLLNVDASSVVIDSQGLSQFTRLNIGDGGSGDLRLTNGSTLDVISTTAGAAFSGLKIGSGFALNSAIGTVVVDASTLLVSGEDVTLDVADVESRASLSTTATGSLDILNGGLVRIDGQTGVAQLRLANGANATGTVTVDGGALEVAGQTANVFLGHDGNGGTGNGEALLRVINGGTLSVTGAGPTGTNVFVGLGTGNGVLEVGTGGRADIAGQLRISSSGPINDTQTGVVRVTDTGVITALSTVVGNRGLLQGDGTFTTDVLIVEAGGNVLLDSLAGVGALVLDSGALVTSTSSIGRATGQRLDVINGGLLDTTSGLDFGSQAGTRADVTVAGTGRISTFGNLLLGNVSGGASVLSVLADGNVSVTGDVLVAAGSSLAAGASGSALSARNITLDGGAMTVGAFGGVDVTDRITVTNGGGLTLGGGGTLRAGSIVVDNGGQLGGTGTLIVPDVLIGAGGTLGPGNSPGTLDVQGNVTLDGGRFIFEIGGTAASQFDQLNVQGDLDLRNGVVELLPFNGYQPASGERYEIFTVTGLATVGPGMNLTFNGLGPDFELTFANNGLVNVGTLEFLNVDIQEAVGLTENQVDVAVYIDEVCPRVEGLADPTADEADLDLVCGNLRNTRNTPEQIESALDAIAPEEIIGVVDTLLGFTTVQHGNLSQRLSGLRAGGVRVNVSGLDIVTDNVHIAGRDLQRFVEKLVGGAAGGTDDFAKWGFFSDGNFNFGDKAAGEFESGFDFDTINITLGADYRISSSFFLGGAVGYNEVNADFDAGGGMITKATSLSLMGTYFRGESFYVDGMFTYGWTEADTSRVIRYTDTGGLLDRRATGNTDGSQIIASIGTGLDFSRGTWVFGPHAGSSFSELRLDAFNETGASGLNLILPDQTSRSITANAGLHVSRVFTPGWGVFVPYLRLDYVHEFENGADEESIQLLADRFLSDPLDPSRPAAVRTDGADPHYWAWSLGGHAQFVHGFSAFLNYKGTEGISGLDLGEITVGLRMERSF